MSKSFWNAILYREKNNNKKFLKKNTFHFSDISPCLLAILSSFPLQYWCAKISLLRDAELSWDYATLRHMSLQEIMSSWDLKLNVAEELLWNLLFISLSEKETTESVKWNSKGKTMTTWYFHYSLFTLLNLQSEFKMATPFIPKPTNFYPKTLPP